MYRTHATSWGPRQIGTQGHGQIETDASHRTNPDKFASDLHELASKEAQAGNTEQGNLLPDVGKIRKHFPDYNPTTAREVLDAILKAQPVVAQEGRKLGATLIKSYCTLSRETIQRYLSAFRDYGLKEWKGVPLS